VALEKKKAKILTVDDDPEVLSTISFLLKKEGYEVREARDGKEAIKEIHLFKPDLIVLDIMLPILDGYEVLRELRKEYTEESYVPVIMLSTREKVEEKVKSLERGADDYLPKPFEPIELLARIQASLRIKEREEHLKKLALIDPLTGLYNRRYLDTRLKEEINSAERYNYPLSLLMLDVDNFKKANDTWGHHFGDEVLKKVAQVLRISTRETDLQFRFGGDEFVILLPHADGNGSKLIKERIRKNASQVKFKHPFPLSLSIGYSIFPMETRDSQGLIQIADARMYGEKQKKEIL